jgi:membrane protein DedA with SNARE-associated domain
MSGYSYRRFLAWTVPACVVWATLYISVASLAAGTYRELADQLHYAGYIFVAIILVFLVLVFVSKKVIERAERKHLDHDGRDEPQGEARLTDVED